MSSEPMGVADRMGRRGRWMGGPLTCCAALALVAGCAPPSDTAAASVTPAASIARVAPAAPQPAHLARAVPVASLPPGVPEPPAGSNQLVTVLVASPSSTTATLRAWQRGAGGGWTTVLGPVSVKVGTAGIGEAREGVNRTPRGTFGLEQAFGRRPNPGTALPYRQVGTSDWWVSDPKSPAYNAYQHCAPGSCPFDEDAGENLGQAGASYDYAVVIDYNTNPVRSGAGSAFFVHVDAGVPSAGCIEVPHAAEIALLRWLDPAQHPRITIGVG